MKHGDCIDYRLPILRRGRNYPAFKLSKSEVSAHHLNCNVPQMSRNSFSTTFKDFDVTSMRHFAFGFWLWVQMIFSNFLKSRSVGQSVSRSVGRPVMNCTIYGVRAVLQLDHWINSNSSQLLHLLLIFDNFQTRRELHVATNPIARSACRIYNRKTVKRSLFTWKLLCRTGKRSFSEFLSPSRKEPTFISPYRTDSFTSVELLLDMREKRAIYVWAYQVQ